MTDARELADERLAEAITRLAAVVERWSDIYERQIAFMEQALTEHEGAHQTQSSEKLS